MIDLRNNKLFFISILLSITLHVSILFGIPGSIYFPFINPGIFRVMLVNLEEETPSKHNLTKSTSQNILKNFSAKHSVKENRLQINNKDDNERGDKRNIEEDLIKAKSEDTQTTSETSKAQGEFLKTSEDTQHVEAAIDKEKDSKEPVKEEKDKTAYMKSGEPSDKRTSLQIEKTSGEIFYYDIFWIGIYVGKAVLKAVDNEGVIRITSQVHSAPFVSAFYKVEDYAESLLMDGIPVNFRIKQHEGKYRSDKETIFDFINRNVTFFNYLSGTKDEHIINDGVAWDVISGFYYLRTQSLEIGKTVYIDIFDSNKFYKAEIYILRKEKIKIPSVGEVDTIIVKPELKSEGLFQKRGDILIWLTDDEKRIPVRVSTKVPVGSVVAELRDFTVEK